MRRSMDLSTKFVCLLCATILPCAADNPIIQTNFTADPAPLVYNGVVYLYTSHDEDDATSFHMVNWKLYTSKDMMNWTDHGTVASLAIFPWANQANDAWAPQVVERSGKFYLYAPVTVPGSSRNVIGVAEADSPLGPFHDPLGHPLIDRGEGFFDPTVYTDDDGQAYLYWGNPKLWYVKLNRDMISYEGKIVESSTRPANYQEGPWFYKRGGRYYMAYASHCCPEGIGYAMSDNPTGPWQYKGMLMNPDELSSGNHPGIVDYKGGSYIFGFTYELNRALTDVHRERRSVSVSKFLYNPDGTIPTLPWFSREGVAQLEPLDPYRPTEAETIAWESGIRTSQSGVTGVYVTPIRSGSYIKVAGVAFGEVGPSTFEARVAAHGPGGSIELHLDSVDSPRIGTVDVHDTGGWWNWQTERTVVSGSTGTHDLYLVFKRPRDGDLFNFDSWQFSRRHASHYGPSDGRTMQHIRSFNR